MVCLGLEPGRLDWRRRRIHWAMATPLVLQILQNVVSFGILLSLPTTIYQCFRLVLLNKLLEDGNTLFRHGRLNEAAYRYEYALKRLPRLKETCNSGFNQQSFGNQSEAFQEPFEEDIFVVLKSHLLLNLSRYILHFSGTRILWNFLKSSFTFKWQLW